MLRIRYMRTGRRNKAFFRVVLTDRRKPTDSGFIKVLGWYDPHTKKTSLEKEAILNCLNNGAVPTNSISRLFEKNDIKHKLVKFVKAKERAPKGKKEDGAPTPEGVGVPTESVGKKPAAKQDADVKVEDQPEKKVEEVTEKPAEENKEAESEPEAPMPEGVGVPTENVGKKPKEEVKDIKRKEEK